MKLSNIKLHDVVVAKADGAGYGLVLKEFAGKQCTVDAFFPDEYALPLITHPSVRHKYTSDPKHLRKLKLAEYVEGDRVYFTDKSESFGGQEIPANVVLQVKDVDLSDSTLFLESPHLSTGSAWVRFNKHLRKTVRELTPLAEPRAGDPVPKSALTLEDVKVGAKLKALRSFYEPTFRDHFVEGEVYTVRFTHCDTAELCLEHPSLGNGHGYADACNFIIHEDVVPQHTFEHGDVLRCITHHTDDYGTPVEVDALVTYDCDSPLKPECILTKKGAWCSRTLRSHPKHFEVYAKPVPTELTYVPVSLQNTTVGDTVRIAQDCSLGLEGSEGTVVRVDACDSRISFKVRLNSNGRTSWEHNDNLVKKVEK